MFEIVAIFRNETTYFIEQISQNARRVIYSDLVHTFVSPLTEIFLGAFIWRNTGSLLSVACYKIGEWIFLPVVFYLNGRLLQKYAVQKTFALGSVLAGISPLALMFFGASNNALIFLYGCLYGIGNGFYYANRNYLEFKETMAKARGYFFSLLSSISGFAGIVVPLVAGWFIFFGTQTHWYTATYAYWGLFVIAFFLLLLCAAIIRRGNFAPAQLDSLIIRSAFFWTKRRILYFAHGFIDGIGFISTLLLLYLFGNEGALGTAVSITTICIIIASYLFGRFAKERYERITLAISAVLFFISGLALVCLPQVSGIVLYVLIMSVISNFAIIVSTSIGLTLADQENKNLLNSRYAFIVDNELFLNFGRIAGIAIIVSLAIFGSQRLGLFYGPLVISLVHVLCLIIFFKKSTT